MSADTSTCTTSDASGARGRGSAVRLAGAGRGAVYLGTAALLLSVVWATRARRAS